MTRNKQPVAVTSAKSGRRRFTDEFKAEAVQMLLGGHTASLITDRLGLGGANSLYHWRRQFLLQSRPVTSSLEARVQELETELRRVVRERDLSKDVGYFRLRRVTAVRAVVSARSNQVTLLNAIRPHLPRNV